MEHVMHSSECGDTKILYQVTKSRRKTIAIAILPDKTVLVKAPHGLPNQEIQELVRRKSAWILKHLSDSESPNSVQSRTYTPEERRQYLEQARIQIPDRVRYFAGLMGESEIGVIRLKELKSRWGSCSTKRNLNFNWKLILAPPQVLDYVVVHELCHLKIMNHSAQFWAYVERICPDYKSCRRWLRENGRGL